MSHQITQKLPLADLKGTLRSIQFQTVLSQCLEGFCEILKVIFHDLNLYHHVIYISLHIPSQLLF